MNMKVVSSTSCKHSYIQDLYQEGHSYLPMQDNKKTLPNCKALAMIVLHLTYQGYDCQNKIFRKM